MPDEIQLCFKIAGTDMVSLAGTRVQPAAFRQGGGFRTYLSGGVFQLDCNKRTVQDEQGHSFDSEGLVCNFILQQGYEVNKLTKLTGSRTRRF